METVSNLIFMAEESEIKTDSAQDAEQKKVKREVEVQMTVKWVNFTFETEAISGDDALEQAYASYKAKGLEEFVITAGGIECSTLEDIFRVAEDFTKVTDQDGNDICGWDAEACQSLWNDEDEEEENED